MIGEQRYIGVINLENVRNYIIDNDTTDKTIWLHPHNYDEFAADYMKHYSTGIPDPFTYVGVDIECDQTRTVTQGRIFVGVEGDRYPNTTIGKVMRWKAK